MQKRDAGERNSAYAPEKLFVSLYVLSFCFRRLNALRAAVESGFPSARYAVRVALFAPVEYLTYGSRKAVLPARAALRIARNDFPCKGHPKQAQSISTTTPVWQIRICTAFCKSKNNFSTNQTPGKIQGRGAAAPFLVVLRGIVKGENRNSPLTMLSFDRQRRFLSHMRKKAGLKPSLFCQDRKEWIAGGIPIDFSIVTCYTSIVNHKR